MKTKYLMPMAALLPLLVVAVLALIGMIFNFWVYIILAIVCPLVAGFLWFTYKDTERKVREAERR